MGKRLELRDKLREKQGGLCCYCQVAMSPRNPPGGTSETLEHLKRKAEGGDNSHDNMALACHDCNTSRGEVDWLTYTSYRRGELMENNHVFR